MKYVLGWLIFTAWIAVFMLIIRWALDSESMLKLMAVIWYATGSVTAFVYFVERSNAD